MSDADVQLDNLKHAAKPCLFRFDWPNSVGANADSVCAAIFAANETEYSPDMIIVGNDGRFLGLSKLKRSWRITSGDFVGRGSRVDAQIVRVDNSGSLIGPNKSAFLRMLPGNNGAECTWQEALGVAIHFVGLGGMPLKLAWWNGERNP